MQFYNMIVLALEAAVYFLFLITLLHWRHRIGIGVFITVLGTMHFLETYLAFAFYVPVPGATISPGSVVFFSGKLLMVLLLYIKEDASTVRQLIYGLLVGNIMVFALAVALNLHIGVQGPEGMAYDDGILQNLGVLMLWGTTLLFVDTIAIIMIYERLGSIIGRHTLRRFFVAGSIVLAFDQIGFYTVLHAISDAPAEVFWGGLVAKLVANALFIAMTGCYLYCFRADIDANRAAGMGDIFYNLTYRERYQDLLARSGRDALTGVHDRGRLEVEAPDLIREALKAGSSISLMVLDADHFKDINDRYGHLRGDEVLKNIALVLTGAVRKDDRVYRFGGEEFVVISRGLDSRQVLAIAERIRIEVGRISIPDDSKGITASIGVASAPADGTNLIELISAADRRLYRAKAEGRNRVIAE